MSKKVDSDIINTHRVFIDKLAHIQVYTLNNNAISLVKSKNYSWKTLCSFPIPMDISYVLETSVITKSFLGKGFQSDDIHLTDTIEKQIKKYDSSEIQKFKRKLLEDYLNKKTTY